MTSTLTFPHKGKRPHWRGVTGDVILDFGKPDYSTSLSDYGTYDFNSVFVPFRATNDDCTSTSCNIETAVENFANAYANNAQPGDVLYISVGTSNASLSSFTGSLVSEGEIWADTVNDVQTYLNDTSDEADIMSAAAGYDAEQGSGYSTYALTQDVLTGYDDATNGNLVFVDGTASGGSGWTTADMYSVAFGDTYDYPAPQLYCQDSDPSLPQEWGALSTWALDNDDAAIYFPGVTTGNGNSGYEGLGGCGSEAVSTAAQSYNGMVNEMQSCDCTANGGPAWMPDENYVAPL